MLLDVSKGRALDFLKMPHLCGGEVTGSWCHISEIWSNLNILQVKKGRFMFQPHPTQINVVWDMCGCKLEVCLSSCYHYKVSKCWPDGNNGHGCSMIIVDSDKDELHTVTLALNRFSWKFQHLHPCPSFGDLDDVRLSPQNCCELIGLISSPLPCQAIPWPFDCVHPQNLSCSKHGHWGSKDVFYATTRIAEIVTFCWWTSASKTRLVSTLRSSSRLADLRTTPFIQMRRTCTHMRTLEHTHTQNTHAQTHPNPILKCKSWFRFWNYKFISGM